VPTAQELAQARAFSLSEGSLSLERELLAWARLTVVCLEDGIFLLLQLLITWFTWLVPFKVWNIWICMKSLIVWTW